MLTRLPSLPSVLNVMPQIVPIPVVQNLWLPCVCRFCSSHSFNLRPNDDLVDQITHSWHNVVGSIGPAAHAVLVGWHCEYSNSLFSQVRSFLEADYHLGGVINRCCSLVSSGQSSYQLVQLVFQLVHLVQLIQLVPSDVVQLVQLVPPDVVQLVQLVPRVQLVQLVQRQSTLDYLQSWILQ